jgi:hypothetical protein
VDRRILKTQEALKKAVIELMSEKTFDDITVQDLSDRANVSRGNTAVGSEVTKFAVGDRVGVGCYVDSCGACEYCLKGEEQFCTKGVVGRKWVCNTWS